MFITRTWLEVEDDEVSDGIWFFLFFVFGSNKKVHFNGKLIRFVVCSLKVVSVLVFFLLKFHVSISILLANTLINTRLIK